MSKRHPNHCHVKIHRNYSVEEIADLFGTHKNTVRNWHKNGLASIDDRKPMLFYGQTLATFLQAKRAKNKRPCKVGEIYCIRCRAPKKPAGDMAEYQLVTATVGNLVAICPDCELMMNRRISISKLEQFRSQMDITLPQALQQVRSESFRLGGDEFIQLVESKKEADDNMVKVKEILDQAIITYTLPDGTVRTKKGIGFSYGTGNSIKEADAAGKKDKSARAAQGLRFERDVADRMVEDNAAGRETGDQAAGREVSAAPETAVNNAVIQSLQNRNRNSKASILQMNAIADNPNPRLLAASPTMENGAPVVTDIANKGIVAQTGNTDVITTGKREIPFRYAVVEADQLAPSNFADGSRNPDYATDTSKFTAINNGRVAGVVEAYRRGTAKAYREALAVATGVHGINEGVVRGMKRPVLVRLIDAVYVTDSIGDESNTTGTLGLSAVEQSRNDASRLDIEALTFNEDGTPTKESVSRFISAMPKGERQSLAPDGRATRQAEDRLLGAVLWQAYGDQDLVGLAVQATEAEARTVITALTNVAHTMMKLEGSGDLDIRPLIVEATKAVVNAGRRGMSVKTLAGQRDLVQSNDAQAILDMFALNIRSAKAITERLDNAATFTVDAATHDTAGDMFGGTKTTRQDVLRRLSDDTTRTENLGQQGRGRPNEEDAQRGAENTTGQRGNRDVAQPTKDYGTDLLTSYTKEDLKTRKNEFDAIEKEKAKVAAVLSKQEKARSEHENIKQASVGAAKTFELGQDAATNLSGQDSLFERAKHYDPNQLLIQLNDQELRPGEDTEQTRADRAGLTANALMRGADGSLLGLAIATDWIAGKGSSLIGKRVTSPQDLATLGAVLRDPRAETMRYFLIKEGKVVYHTAVSSRLPGSSAAFTDNSDVFLGDLNATMKRLGADGYYLMHNHPGRNVRASDADLRLTSFIANELPGFLGHTILDHTEFGLIETWSDGSQKNSKTALYRGAQPLNVTSPDPTRTNPIPHAKLDEVVGGPQSLASMADAVRQPDNIVLVAVDGQMHVTGIMQVSRDSMKEGKLTALKNIARLRKAAGSNEVFAVLPDGMRFDELAINFTKSGWLLDVNIAVAGVNVSAVDKNMMAFQRGGAKGKERLGVAVDQPTQAYTS